MDKTITIEIEADGATKVSAQGFKGKSCQEATDQLEQLLGSVKTSTKTSEFYQKEEVKVGTRSNR